jgi:hypothetical protein
VRGAQRRNLCVEVRIVGEQRLAEAVIVPSTTQLLDPGGHWEKRSTADARTLREKLQSAFQLRQDREARKRGNRSFIRSTPTCFATVFSNSGV